MLFGESQTQVGCVVQNYRSQYYFLGSNVCLTKDSSVREINLFIVRRYNDVIIHLSSFIISSKRRIYTFYCLKAIKLILVLNFRRIPCNIWREIPQQRSEPYFFTGCVNFSLIPSCFFLKASRCQSSNS
jgi:hypothetical protein